jgi:hypothetical protein
MIKGLRKTKKAYTVVMSSIEYGIEEFYYDTLREALKGLDRLIIQSLRDDVYRTFSVGVSK